MASNTDLVKISDFIKNSVIVDGALYFTAELVARVYGLNKAVLCNIAMSVGLYKKDHLRFPLLDKLREVIPAESLKSIDTILRAADLTKIEHDWDHWLRRPEVLASKPGLYALRTDQSDYLVAVKDNFIEDVNDAIDVEKVTDFLWFIETPTQQVALDIIKVNSNAIDKKLLRVWLGKRNNDNYAELRMICQKRVDEMTATKSAAPTESVAGIIAELKGLIVRLEALA